MVPTTVKITASYCAYYKPVKISPNHKTLSDSVCLLGFTADLTDVTGISSVFAFLLSPTPAHFPEFSPFSYTKEDLSGFD